MRTRSIWPALLMHTLEDAMIMQLFEGNLIQIVPGTDWLISPMNDLLMVLFFLVLGIGLHQARKRAASVSRKADHGQQG